MSTFLRPQTLASSSATGDMRTDTHGHSGMLTHMRRTLLEERSIEHDTERRRCAYAFFYAATHICFVNTYACCPGLCVCVCAFSLMAFLRVCACLAIYRARKTYAAAMLRCCRLARKHTHAPIQKKRAEIEINHPTIACALARFGRQHDRI